eukprot:Em0449g1a
MADSEQSTRRPKRTAKRTQKALEQEGGCEEMQTPSVEQCKRADTGRDSEIDGGDAASSDSTRRRQEVLPQWKQGDMRRNSDGGDAASSDSTRRRQEPQWKQGDMRRNSDGGDAASSDSTSEDKKNLSGSKLICGAVLMMVTLLLVLAPGEDKNLSGSKLICGAVQVVAMLLQVIAPGEDKKELPVHMFLVTGPGFFSGHEQSPSLKSFSSSESEQSQNQEMITLLMSINGKLSHILDHISEQAKSVSKKENSAVEFAQESHNEEDWFNGVNLTLIPKRNIYTYGLSLLDIFFSKKELRESLLFPSMKSPKPSLCPEKVQRIIATIKRQFPTEPFDLAVFTTKANQKCRDS